MEQVLELDMLTEEMAMFEASARAVQRDINKMPG
jgi:hypothetical protein